jgi:hypothetical protein
VVGDEKAAEFEALAAALADDLAPDGALQSLLAGRIARAAWRLERAERIEAELFARDMGSGDLGLALIRDGHGARAFNTLLRYRGTALAELWRALRLLKALQAEPAPDLRDAAPREIPIETEARTIAGETAPMPAADEPEANFSGAAGVPTLMRPARLPMDLRRAPASTIQSNPKAAGILAKPHACHAPASPGEANFQAQ